MNIDNDPEYGLGHITLQLLSRDRDIEVTCPEDVTFDELLEHLQSFCLALGYYPERVADRLSGELVSDREVRNGGSI